MRTFEIKVQQLETEKNKVKKNKKPIYLEPMNPNERRIIHSALQRDPEVITKSEGKDPYRKVVVMLKK